MVPTFHCSSPLFMTSLNRLHITLTINFPPAFRISFANPSSLGVLLLFKSFINMLISDSQKRRDIPV